MAAAGWVMDDERRWSWAIRGGRLGRAAAGKRGVIGPTPLPMIKSWTDSRDLPSPPKQTFRDWWRHNHQDHDDLGEDHA